MIDDWNIDGIAQEVLEEMREEDAGIDEIDYFVHRIAYQTVFSRMPDDAQGVEALVKEKVLAGIEREG